MSVVDLREMPALSSTQLSPDVASLLYVRSDADWKQKKPISHIWRQSTSGGSPVQLTNGERGESSPL